MSSGTPHPGLPGRRFIPSTSRGFPRFLFAGLFFDIIFAFTSGYSVVGLAGCIAPITAFIMVLVTYVMFRRRNPAIKITG